MLNPHLSGGSKDWHASNVFYEALAGWDMDGNLVPILAAEIPSLENGGVAKNLLSVTWKLKRGVTWHAWRRRTAAKPKSNTGAAATLWSTRPGRRPLPRRRRGPRWVKRTFMPTYRLRRGARTLPK